MLVLSRRPGEKLILGEGITVTVLEVVGNRVRLDVAAPADVCILRGELACWLDPETGPPNRTAPSPAGQPARV
jgi:carbon storage regulator